MYESPYKELPDTQVNRELETFRMCFNHTSVLVRDGYMTYKVHYKNQLNLSVVSANSKIKELGLNLYAEINGQNTFIIKPK